jgi:flagellar biosynthesis protein FlhF
MSESLARIGDRENKAEPYILALVGPSGAGKTTLMYKLAVRAVLNFGLRVKIISCDTYKIGSVEGVQTIAEILSVPYGIAFQPSEVRELIAASDVDLIIVDTAGRSDRTSREELAEFIAAASPDEVHLVLSSTMSQRALQETAALFLGERITCVTFTKLDEAPSLGGLISAIQWMDLPVGYLSTGTEIPDDLLPSSDAPLGEWSVEGAPVADHDPEAKHV